MSGANAKKKAQPRRRPPAKGQDAVPVNDNEKTDLLDLNDKWRSLDALLADLGDSPEIVQARARLAEAAMWCVHHITRQAIARSSRESRSPMNLLGAVCDFAVDTLEGELNDVGNEFGALEHRLQTATQVIADLVANHPLEQLTKEQLPAVIYNADGDPIDIWNALQEIEDGEAFTFRSLKTPDVDGLPEVTTDAS